MKYHPFINGLRALAVVPVILFHFSTGVFTGGYAGVDVFFVISGFLITGLLMGMLEKKNFSIVTFYERRARRILPALFIMCAMCLCFCWVYFMPEDFKLFGRSLLGAALFGTNFTFLEDVGYFASPALIKPLLHTWSLAVEEQFYIFYPLILFGLYKWAAHKDKRKLVLCVFGLFLVSLALNLVLISRNPEATFYLLHTRAWELLAGALTCLYLQDIRLTKPQAEAAGVAGFALLLFAYTCYDRETAFPGAAAIAPVLGTVLLIWSNLRAQTLSGKVLSWKPMIGVGLISYGLYLYHWPLLVFARYYLEREMTGAETALTLALVAGISTVSYFVFEQPVRERKMLITRRAVFATSLAGLLVMGLIGTIGTKADGLPQRFSGPVLQYVTDDAAPKEDCTPLSNAKRDRQQLCKFGIGGKHADFVLWGDSHADKISPGLDAVAKEKHLSGFKIWSAGCPPLLNLSRLGKEKYKCAEDNDRAFKYIQESGAKKIILVGRWDVIFPPEKGSMEDLRDRSGPRVKLTKDGSEIYDAAAFAQAFHDTIKALEGLGAHVYVVKQAPPHLQYLSTELAKDTYLGRDTGELKRPIDEVLARRAPIDRVFEGTRDSSVTFIDLLKKFCPDGKSCIVEANGRALYHDDTHLSVYGAMWVKDIWQPVLK